MNRKTHAQHIHGFTLLEVMVALVIFSMIAVGATTLLINIRRSEATLEERGNQLTELQQLVLITRHDLSQSAPGAPPEQLLTFNRTGWSNSLLEARSHLVRVNYNYDATKKLFVRSLQPFATAPDKNISFVKNYAPGIEGLKFSALPAPNTPAMEMTFTLPAFSEIRTVSPLGVTP